MADTAISAANQQIAFHSDGDVAIVDFEWDATGLMQLVPSTLSNLTTDGFHLMDEYPAWSPDGRYLAWRRGGRQLIVRDVQTDEEQVVVEEGVCSELTWSPDGRQLAFVGRLPGERPDSPPGLVRVLNWRASENLQVIAAPITADRLQHLVAVDWNPDRSPAVRTD